MENVRLTIFLWLDLGCVFRGHLDNIANNTLIGAVNAFNERKQFCQKSITGEYGGVPCQTHSVPIKTAGVYSVVVGDHNYGEGSSREHAAMQPRHLGVAAVIVKSFATNSRNESKKTRNARADLRK